jgi:hypothetical protein
MAPPRGRRAAADRGNAQPVITAAVAATLLVLALLDGTFAGFRASVGRTGLIDHRAADRRAAVRGGTLVLALLAPSMAAAGADALTHPARLAAYRRAGEAMLAVYGPYAVLVLAALLSYSVLGWRQRYLASALILGPFTFLRPAIAIIGAAYAAVVAHDTVVALIAVLAAAAVLRPPAPHRGASATVVPLRAGRPRRG